MEASHDLLLDVASDLDEEAAAAAEHALVCRRCLRQAGPGCEHRNNRRMANPSGEPGSAVRHAARAHPAAQGDPEAPLQALVTNPTRRRSWADLPSSASTTASCVTDRRLDALRGRSPVVTSARITELLATVGVERSPTDEAVAGDIVAVAGLPEIMIGDTLADPDHVYAPRITVDEPRSR